MGTIMATTAAIATSFALPLVFIIPAPYCSTKLELSELRGRHLPQSHVLPFWIWQLPSV